MTWLLHFSGIAMGLVNMSLMDVIIGFRFMAGIIKQYGSRFGLWAFPSKDCTGWNGLNLYLWDQNVWAAEYRPAAGHRSKGRVTGEESPQFHFFFERPRNNKACSLDFWSYHTYLPKLSFFHRCKYYNINFIFWKCRKLKNLWYLGMYFSNR